MIDPELMKTEDLTLLPRPKHMTIHGGHVSAPSWARLPENLPELIRNRAHTLCSGDSGPVFEISITDTFDSPEAYELRCTQDLIALTGGSPAGIWFGLQTLGQLYESGGNLPCVEIFDTPDFKERGFMLDISRNKVPTMESLFTLVDLLGSLKINQLQLYTEHTFAYTGHELVWGESSPMTGKQIRALDAYCRDRYIELVPNQNSFGHMERWLRWPEYHHLAECPHGWNFGEHLSKECGTVLKPDAQSLAFVDSLHRELLPNFSSRKFNIGCDETWELGQGWSRPQAEKTGKHAVYLDFLVQLAEQVAGHGREPLFWADILLKQPEAIDRLPEGMIPVLWGYEADHPFDKECPLVAKSGLQFHVAPGTSTWKTLTGNLTNAFPNLLNAARNGLAHRARGYLVTNWGDLGHHQTWPLTLPGLAYGAALAWSVDANADVALAPALAPILGDPSGELAEILLAAGSLDTRFPLPEGNLADRLFKVFFSRNANLSHHLRDLRPELLEAIGSHLDASREKTTAFVPESREAAQIREDLLLSLDLAGFAVMRSRAWLDHVEQDKPLPRAQLRATLQELIGRFEQVWLARNRPGGLHDSSSRMRTILLEFGERPASIDYNPH